jgi:phosphatidylglycerophosphatase A
MRSIEQLFPWTQFVETPVILRGATLFGLGQVGKAPGTLGSLAGLGWYVLAFYWGAPALWLLLTLFGVYLAIAFSHEAEKRLFEEDPSEVVIDEFVAVPLVFFAVPMPILNTPMTWLVLLAGFGLFRFFDIVKPLGIRRLQKLEGGLGVVADDLAAAAASCVTLHLGLWATHNAGWW